MFSIKSETSDTIDEGKDSQRIRCIDTNRNLHIGDTLSTNTSDNWPDKDLSEKMLFTVAYVKNESTSNALDYHPSNSKGNKCMNEQYLANIHAMKMEKVEGCSSNKPGNVTKEEHVMMNVKEDLQHNHTIEHDINHLSDTSQDDRTIEHEYHHVADTSQHDRAGGNTAINIGVICPSSATEPRAGMQKYIHKRVLSGEKCFECNLCVCSTTTYGTLTKLKLIHARETPYKCDICDYNTTTSRHLINKNLTHLREKPYTCNLCDYSAERYGHLKTHKLIHTGEKPYKCDLCAYSARTSRHLKRHELVHFKRKAIQL